MRRLEKFEPTEAVRQEFDEDDVYGSGAIDAGAIRDDDYSIIAALL